MDKKYEVKFTITGSRGDTGSFTEGEKKSFSCEIACRVVGAKIADPVGWKFDPVTGKEKVGSAESKKAEKAVTEVKGDGGE